MMVFGIAWFFVSLAFRPFVLAFALGGPHTMEELQDTLFWLDLGTFTIFFTCATLIYWHYKDSSPGKMAFSSRLIDAESGNTPSTQQYLSRYLSGFLSSLPFCLGYIWIGIDPKKQGWHDRIAGTLVVRLPRGEYKTATPARKSALFPVMTVVVSIALTVLYAYSLFQISVEF